MAKTETVSVRLDMATLADIDARRRAYPVGARPSRGAIVRSIVLEALGEADKAKAAGPGTRKARAK